MDCNATTVEKVTFDNGTTICVERVIAGPEYDSTFLVVRDAKGEVQTFMVDNVRIVTTEWVR